MMMSVITFVHCFVAVCLKIMSHIQKASVTGRLIGVTLGRWTCNHEVVSLTPGRVAIKWLVPGWVTVCGQVNHLGI